MNLLKYYLRKFLRYIGYQISIGNNIQNDLYYSAIFNQVTMGSEWLKDKSFAPGHMAVDYCYLYTMYRALDFFRPTNILDIGLGQTTRMFAQYEKWMNGRENTGNVQLVSVEHDLNWTDFVVRQYNFTHEIHLFKLLISVPYQLAKDIVEKRANIYDGLGTWLIQKAPFDFVSVDGPFMNHGYSRPQIIELAKDGMLKDNFVIMVDDMEREGEEKTVELLLAKLKANREKVYVKIYNGAKKHCLITTEKYKFLTSL